jgi:hydroxyacylglutathione hydrolase
MNATNLAERRPMIETFTLGPFATNCYIVYPGVPSQPPTPGTPCWLIDASFDPDPMIERVARLGLQPTLLYLTHAHVDHIAGVQTLRDAFPGMPVALHSAESAWLTDPVQNRSVNFGLPMAFDPAERRPEHGDQLELDGLVFRVLHVPGHSPGSTALVWLDGHGGGEALVGDALFAGSIGRTDLPGGDHEQLLRSIATHLYQLPDPVRAWPGHGPATTIGQEARTNPFVRRER